MLSMLEWLCTELIEVEVDQQLGTEKNQRKISALSAWWYLSCAVWMKTAIGISLPLNLWPKNPGAPMKCCFRIWRTVVCPRPGLSFQIHTPDWFRQFVNPFPTPHGSAARCISCGIFWPMCRRKKRNPNRIREARRRSGVSTLKIASALGICRDTVYRWERGETLLSSSVLLNLGYIFGVTCDWLVCRSDDPYKTVDGVDIRSVESNLDIGI